MLFLRPIFPIFLSATFAILCACLLSFLLQDQITNVVLNLTSNEKINAKRYPWLTTPDGKFFNRFDRWVTRARLRVLTGRARKPRLPWVPPYFHPLYTLRTRKDCPGLQP